MGDRQDTGVVLPEGWQAVVTTAILLVLPSIWPEQLGWTQGFVPIPICYYLVSLGTIKAKNLLINAVLMAGLAASIFGSFAAFVFTCTMLPVGIIIGKAILDGESPPKAGLRAVGILLLVWVAFWTIYGSLTHTNPYQEMLTSMDTSLTAAGDLYQTDASLSLTDKENITNTIQMLRELLRQIAPGLLAITALSTVWLNMLLGQWLINRKLPSQSTWPPFSDWRFPEQLIWIVIGSGIAAVMPIGGAKVIGINILLAVGALYFFQGIAVLAKLFAKWSVPKPMRAFLFAIAILQGAGFVALAALGIADIWVAFGTPKPDKDPASE